VTDPNSREAPFKSLYSAVATNRFQKLNLPQPSHFPSLEQRADNRRTAPRIWQLSPSIAIYRVAARAMIERMLETTCWITPPAVRAAFSRSAS